jgi:membrane-bound lytic murein transglycosylase A
MRSTPASLAIALALSLPCAAVAGGDGLAARPVHPAFTSTDAVAKTVPGWQASYPNLAPVPLTDLFQGEDLDDLEFAGLDVAIGRSRAYLSRLGRRTTSAGRPDVGADQLHRALGALGADLEANRALTLEDLEEHFDAYRTRPQGDPGRSTGYFEPVVDARLGASDEFPWPIYEAPSARRKIEDPREKIVFENSLAGRARPIAYLRTPVDVSILHIQGSAMLDLGDGTIGRVNYHSANGHPYRPIGNKLLDVIPRGQMSLQSIRAYLMAHPERWREVLSHDTSYVFLRIMPEGPVGSIQQVVTAERSIAVDPREVPLGTLCFIRIPSLGISRLVLAQDTGGAIKGPGRLDYFRGTGARAAELAGPMNETAELYVLLPRAPDAGTPDRERPGWAARTPGELPTTLER